MNQMLDIFDSHSLFAELKMSGAMLPFLYVHEWQGQGQLYLYGVVTFALLPSLVSFGS
jgi:hypothetical protein